MKATSFVSTRARVAQPRVNAGLDLVDELKCRRAAKSLLLDDRLDRRLTGEQEARDARWHGIRNIPDAGLRDGPGPLGIRDTRPRADAPIRTAIAASSADAMQ